MAASTELAFTVISLALGLGICTANRAVLNVAREENAVKPPPTPVFREANRPGPMEVITTRTSLERAVGTAGLTEVAGNNRPSKLEDLGGDPFGGDGDPSGGDSNSPDYNSFLLSKWTGQALYCSPLECQGGNRNEYAGDCGGFSIYFNFDGPGAYKKRVHPPATGIEKMPAPIPGGPDCGWMDGVGCPAPPKREQEDGTGMLTDGDNENDLGAAGPIAGVAEPDPGI